MATKALDGILDGDLPMPQAKARVDAEEDSTRTEVAPSQVIDEKSLPLFLKPEEAMTLMRIETLEAFYAAVGRKQVPGAFKRGKKILVDRDVLLKALKSGLK